MTKRITIPVLLTLLLLVTTAGHLRIMHAQSLAGQHQPGDDENVLAALPTTIGRYTQLGKDVPVDDRVKQVLQTSSILTRNYVSPQGGVITVSMVHAGKTRRSLHFPEVCLVGQGWEVMEQYNAPVGFEFTAQHLIIADGQRREAVIYWFKTGEQYTGNFFLNSWYWAREQLRPGGTPTSTMVRLSTYVPGRDDETAFRMLEDMAEQMAPVLLQTIP